MTVKDSSLDALHDALHEEDTGIGELVSDEYDNVVEMFETGSAVFEINGKKFIIAITIQEGE